jgi:hypothetical protein
MLEFDLQHAVDYLDSRAAGRKGRAAARRPRRARGLSANTWLVGEDVFTPAGAGDALRIMNNPTLDGISHVPGNRYIRVKACDSVRCGPYSVAYALATRISGCL